VLDVGIPTVSDAQTPIKDLRTSSPRCWHKSYRGIPFPDVGLGASFRAEPVGESAEESVEDPALSLRADSIAPRPELETVS
jgi:hypothetical protein